MQQKLANLTHCSPSAPSSRGQLAAIAFRPRPCSHPQSNAAARPRRHPDAIPTFVCSDCRQFQRFCILAACVLGGMLRAPIIRAFARLQSLRPGSRPYHASAAVQGLPDDLVTFC